MIKDIILFDVDGTIIDSYEGIRHCAEHTLNVMNYNMDESYYPLFMGAPLIHSFKNYVNMSDEEAVLATDIYREEYNKIGKFKFKVYDSIIDTIYSLKKKGKILATASSKPEYLVKEMLHHVGIDKYFDYIVGASIKNKENKVDIINDAMKRCKVNEINKYILIGDTIFDLNAANDLQMDCIIVKYGFGTEDVFNKAKNVIRTPIELLDIIK